MEIAYFLIVSLILNGGHFAYTLDDPYVHMSMARALADSGTYGITPGHFSSASSSPIWVLLLTPFAYLHLLTIAPLLLNAAACVGILCLLDRDLPPFETSLPRTWLRGVLVISIPTALYLAGLTAMGMEHGLETFLALWLLSLVFRLADPGGPRRRARSGALLVAGIFLATLVRFEFIFMSVAIGCMLAIVGRWRLAAAVPLAGLSAMAAFALCNVAGGGLVLPNSVLARGLGGIGVPPLAQLLDSGAAGVALVRHLAAHLGSNTVRDPFTLVLVLWLAIVALYGFLASPRAPGSGAGPLRPQSRVLSAMAAGLVVLNVLHWTFAAVGWYDRYQAYLNACDVYCLLMVMTRGGLRAALAPFAIALLILPLSQILDLIEAPVASNNIYEQQMQMGRFLGRYYDGIAVAVNDVGLVSYEHTGPVLDLVGLASERVLLDRLSGHWSARVVNRLAQSEGVQVAVIYPDWFRGAIPATWVPVGSWSLSRPDITPAGSTVVFFATSANRAAALRANLDAFDRTLPPGVRTSLYAAPG